MTKDASEKSSNCWNAPDDVKAPTSRIPSQMVDWSFPVQSAAQVCLRG